MSMKKEGVRGKSYYQLKGKAVSLGGIIIDIYMCLVMVVGERREAVLSATCFQAALMVVMILCLSSGVMACGVCPK